MKRYEGLNEYHSTGTGGRAEYQEPDACKCGTCLQVRDCPIPAANATLTPAASRLCLLHPSVGYCHHYPPTAVSRPSPTHHQSLPPPIPVHHPSTPLHTPHLTLKSAYSIPSLLCLYPTIHLCNFFPPATLSLTLSVSTSPPFSAATYPSFSASTCSLLCCYMTPFLLFDPIFFH